MARKRERTFGVNGRWIITGEALDEGGQARIHVVLDSTGVRAGEHVIKLLKNAKRSARLDNEIATTKRLYEAGCPVLEIADDYLESDPAADRPWYVAPRIIDGALDKRLIADQHYGGTFESALNIYRDIVNGVLAIHRQGVAHRDLKPANILLQENRIILADLGLALALGEIEGERLTAELERIGSLHYTPPEAFSRRPLDVHQFAFDAFALGKILYEVVAGKPLPAFVSPMDTEYDITKKWNGQEYRGINRVLRGLLHDNPSVRTTYLGELPGQIDEFLTSAPRPSIPRWHSDLLSASDLLASKPVTVPINRTPVDEMKEEAEQIVREVQDVWEASDAVRQLEEALGVARGGHLTVTKPNSNNVARQLLAGFQATRKGLEPLQDRGYPFGVKAEAGCQMSVSSANPEQVEFRQLWLCMIVGIKGDQTVAATFIVRREKGLQGTTDILNGKLRITSASRRDATLVAKVRRGAAELLDLFVQDVITEVKLAAKQ